MASSVSDRVIRAFAGKSPVRLSVVERMCMLCEVLSAKPPDYHLGCFVSPVGIVSSQALPSVFPYFLINGPRDGVVTSGSLICPNLLSS